MNFNRHSELEGLHAFLSPSSPHWLRYDNDKLRTVWTNQQKVLEGTRLHEFAAQAIDLGQKLSRSRKTLNMYVNDSIGYKQAPEQKLYFSRNCFGTADSIQFRNSMLRIFDLKTGTTPAHPDQLEIYAALFCLEYGIRPREIDMDLRLYQNDEIYQWAPDPDDIEEKMSIIKQHDATISKLSERDM